MRDEISPDSPTFGETAAAAITPDPVTAGLLAKHTAGEKLSQAEYGKVGSWKKKWQSWLGGKGNGGSGPAEPGPEPGHAAPVAPVAPPEAPTDGLAPEPIDAGLARRTTAAVLSRCESIAVLYIGNAARESGATGEVLARLERAAALSKDDKAVMVDISPDVLSAMGVNPRHFPVAVFFGMFGAWATGLWMAVQEIKAQKNHEKTKAPDASP